jgi:hypothetical protein
MDVELQQEESTAAVAYGREEQQAECSSSSLQSLEPLGVPSFPVTLST